MSNDLIVALYPLGQFLHLKIIVIIRHTISEEQLKGYLEEARVKLRWVVDLVTHGCNSNFWHDGSGPTCEFELRWPGEVQNLIAKKGNIMLCPMVNLLCPCLGKFQRWDVKLPVSKVYRYRVDGLPVVRKLGLLRKQ